MTAGLRRAFVFSQRHVALRFLSEKISAKQGVLLLDDAKREYFRITLHEDVKTILNRSVKDIHDNMEEVFKENIGQEYVAPRRSKSLKQIVGQAGVESDLTVCPKKAELYALGDQNNPIFMDLFSVCRLDAALRRSDSLDAKLYEKIKDARLDGGLPDNSVTRSTRIVNGPELQKLLDRYDVSPGAVAKKLKIRALSKDERTDLLISMCKMESEPKGRKKKAVSITSFLAVAISGAITEASKQDVPIPDLTLNEVFKEPRSGRALRNLKNRKVAPLPEEDGNLFPVAKRLGAPLSAQIAF